MEDDERQAAVLLRAQQRPARPARNRIDRGRVDRRGGDRRCAPYEYRNGNGHRGAGQATAGRGFEWPGAHYDGPLGALADVEADAWTQVIYDDDDIWWLRPYWKNHGPIKPVAGCGLHEYSVLHRRRYPNRRNWEGNRWIKNSEEP